MQVAITIDIIEYFPSDFDFTGFNFIFIYDSKQVDKEISYLHKNNVFHKFYIPSKKDIKYSIKMTRNDSLIGLSEFIIPFSILHKREKNYDKICSITMTDSLKKLIFGSSTSSNQIKVNIHSTLQYFGAKEQFKEKFLRKNKSNISKEIYDNKIINLGKEREPKSNRVILNFKSEVINKSISIKKDRNNISNRNILKGQKLYFKNQYSNPFPHTQLVSPKRHLISNIPGTEIKKYSNINLTNEINKNKSSKDEEEVNDNDINDEDPNDRSRIDKILESEEKHDDQKLYEFINNLIKENPLSELDNKKDIGEMIMYTKDIISQLLEYQIKFYDVLKKSVDLNHKFNELLLKYNEKYRYIVKKMNKLTEDMNTHDMKYYIIVNNNKNEKNNINEIMTIKNKELEIFKEIYKVQNEDNIDILTNENNNDMHLKILLSTLQKISSKYGNINTIITEKNSSEKDIQNLNYILNKYKEGLNLNKTKQNISNITEEINIKEENEEVNDKNEENSGLGLEYVLSDNPDDLDKLLNISLKNIYSNKKVYKIIFKRIGKNTYEYGNQKILVRKDDNNIKVRVGGLFTSLEKYIESKAVNEYIPKNTSRKKLPNKSK